jgi:hypothetical protein
MNPDKRPPITDSAWYWVLTFSLVSSAALAAMSFKYDRRQANIERNYQARERVAERITAENNSDDGLRIDNLETRRRYAAPGERLIPLWPLSVLFAIISSVAAVVLYWSRFGPGSIKKFSP